MSKKSEMTLLNVLRAVKTQVAEGVISIGEGLSITAQCEMGRLLLDIDDKLDLIVNLLSGNKEKETSHAE